MGRRSQYYAYYIFTPLLLVIFSGLRYGVGVDYATYIQYFHDMQIQDQLYVEPGYLLLERMVNAIKGEAQLVLFLCAVITIYCTSQFIKFFSNSVAISWIIYALTPIFYLASFNGVRQFVAVALFGASLKYIKQRKILYYIVVIVIAGMFHYSAFLLLPLYFFLNRKFNVFYYVFGFTVSIILFLNLEWIIRYFGYYSFYLVRGGMKEFDIKGLGVIAIFFGSLMVAEKLRARFSSSDIVINLLFLSAIVIMAPIFANIDSSLIMRLSSYFTIAFMIIIPYVISITKDAWLRFWIYTFLVMLISVYYYLTLYLNGETYKLVPYKMNFVLFSWN